MEANFFFFFFFLSLNRKFVGSFYILWLKAHLLTVRFSGTLQKKNDTAEQREVTGQE